MKTRFTQLQRRGAKLAGVLYAALFVLAIVTNFLVVGSLISPSDPHATQEAIASNQGLFRLGILGFVLIAFLDVVIAWALNLVFTPISESLSKLATWLRLIYSVFLGLGVVFMQLALHQALESNISSMVFLLRGFEISWELGLMFFGSHLLVIAFMMIRDKAASALLGSALAMAGSAYLADSIAKLVIVDYSAIAGLMMLIVAVPSIVAELAFTFWLICSGWSKPSTADSVRS